MRNTKYQVKKEKQTIKSKRVYFSGRSFWCCWNSEQRQSLVKSIQHPHTRFSTKMHTQTDSKFKNNQIKMLLTLPFNSQIVVGIKLHVAHFDLKVQSN